MRRLYRAYDLLSSAYVPSAWRINTDRIPATNRQRKGGTIRPALSSPSPLVDRDVSTSDGHFASGAAYPVTGKHQRAAAVPDGDAEPVLAGSRVTVIVG